MNYYRRPFWHNKLFVFLLLLLCSGLGFVYWSITRPLPATQTTAELQRTLELSEDLSPVLIKKDGKLRVIDRLDGEEKEIIAQDSIQIGDTIKTFTESGAMIQFGAAGFVRLDADSQLQIVQADENEIMLRQLTGQAYHHITNPEVTLTVMSLDAQFNSTASIYSLNTRSLDNELDIVALANDIDVQITQANIPIAALTINEGTIGTIKPQAARAEMTDFSKIDTAEILEDNRWIAFNYEQDVLNEYESGILTNTSLPSEIVLNATYENGTVYLDWKLEDGEAPAGFRVVMTDEEDVEPTYPDHANHFISDNSKTRDTWKNLKDGVYKFRVGLYDGTGKILKYSNTAAIDLSNISETASINLETSQSENTVQLNWTAQGIENIEGFYIIAGESQNPRYPSDNYQKVDGNASNYNWENIDTELTYNFRVCAIVNGNCYKYSNNVTSSFDKKVGHISLGVTPFDTNVLLEWQAQNLTSNNLGYRILLSESPNPSIESSIVKTIDSRSTKSYTWTELLPNRDYYFAICEYIGDNTCGVFSNTVPVSLTKKTSTLPSGNIKITGYYTWGKLHINWETEGIPDHDGYIVLVSESPTPTYPQADHRLLDKTTFYDSWTVDSGKTYYIRTCAHKNNACTIYSNELKVKAL
jgi:hypothetical protein